MSWHWQVIGHAGAPAFSTFLKTIPVKKNVNCNLSG
jgi:hypothetical protein